MWAVIIPLLLCCVDALIYPKVSSRPVIGSNYGDPLFLTPYIKSGKYQEAQLISTVKPLKAQVQSHAGFLTVDERYNSSMFFWYFPAESKPEKAPVVIWLQGGPGASSLFGLFEEHGPFYVGKERGLKMRRTYWSQVAHMIYIDNPVGTGFSFTENDLGYARNEDDVGRNLYEAVKQFLQLFPNLQRNDFFVTGESYAGKYVPALALTIHKNNPNAPLKVNLKGIAIGNGLVDPENMMVYGNYLYQLGLIDLNGRDQFKKREQEIVGLIRNKKYEDAFRGFDELLNGDLIPYKSLFYNLTQFESYFNYFTVGQDSIYGDLNRYLQKDLFRRSIHVGNLTFDAGTEVEKHLLLDVMQTARPSLEVLLNNYRVLIYNGQLDIICAYPLTENYVQNLKWSGSADYLDAKRKPWLVDGKLAGYYKEVKGFREVLVRNAGHMVPSNQPEWALDLIRKFIFNLAM